MAQILVIDDEHNVRSMIRLALEHVGYEVAAAADGPEGLDKFVDGAEWDLTLLDQRMPGMEGMAVLREMRRRDPDARVIIITAFGTVDLAVDAMKSGATDFLRKPFTPEVLRGAVQAALAGESAPDIESAALVHPPAFVRVTYNGFRIAQAESEPDTTGGEARYRFEVSTPRGETQPCTVVLSRAVTSVTGSDVGAGRGLSEQALANHLWQNAEVPSTGEIRIEELTSDLRRWVSAYHESHATAEALRA